MDIFYHTLFYYYQFYFFFVLTFKIFIFFTVNGQVSPKFTIVPPTDKVTVPGYPNPIFVNGAYLPPRVDSMLPTSGPTSGCRKFEEVQLWEERMAAGDTEGK